MEGALKPQKFNDDLLLGKEDRERAAECYRPILHVLDDRELRECFTRYDKTANAAKTKSKKRGAQAICFGGLAILCASAEIIFYQSRWLLLSVATLGAGFGISGLIIGSVGVLSGRTKMDWLHRRLVTERLRQFHFQTFVSLLPDILASLQDGEVKASFILTRHRYFDVFRTDIENKLAGAFTSVINDDEAEIWFRKPPEVPPTVEDHKELEPLFDAYRELRIMHQISYADYKLREDDGGILPDAARRQAAMLEKLGFLCIGFLLSIHIAIAVAIAIATGAALLNYPLSVSLISSLVSVLSAAIIWIAVVALAARAFEQGLQPGREVERYQEYRSACKAVLERFDKSSSQSEKIRIMTEMERLSFDEMRNFLITNSRARFVM